MTDASYRRSVCAIPYRVQNLKVEFCLIAHPGQSRWVFPQLELGAACHKLAFACQAAAAMVGLLGEVEHEEPLAEYTASRNEQLDVCLAFLIRIDEEAPIPSEDMPPRRRWCLPEEARVRVRRKPVQRLIDAALQQIHANRPAK